MKFNRQRNEFMIAILYSSHFKMHSIIEHRNDPIFLELKMKKRVIEDPEKER